jgi:ABC-type dipeptide/oligopeptide/nickel transport system permease subunit
VGFPGITIFLTVLASNLFGNAVRDAFDPRLKSQ